MELGLGRRFLRIAREFGEDEKYGIWGQTINGFVENGQFYVMYPSLRIPGTTAHSPVASGVPGPSTLAMGLPLRT